MLVFVLNKHNRPLMPCSPAKARRLLKEGKAKCVRRTPFTIKLLHGSSGFKQEVSAGMDTGSKTIGTAAVAIGKVLFQAETHLRGEEIKRKMEQRAMYRRSRRGRKLRYRAPRFLNRRASTRLDRLPPSIRHKVESHLREKKFVESILPVTRGFVETASFDIHKISNPSVSKKHGWTYQKGQQLGFYNTKAFVLNRDQYTCQKCKKKGVGKSAVKLHVHHIVFKSNGGTNAPNNLITLCESCHSKIHDYKNSEKESLKLQKTAQKQTKHASEVSVLRSQLSKKFGDFEETFGYITKFNREQVGLAKTHSNDAIVIALQGELLGNSDKFKTVPVLIRKMVSKGDYQQNKGIRSEKKITTTKILGYRKFDKIKWQGKTGFIKGRMSSGYAVLMDIFGKKIDIKPMAKLKSKQLQRLSARNLILVSIGTINYIHRKGVLRGYQ